MYGLTSTQYPKPLVSKNNAPSRNASKKLGSLVNMHLAQARVGALITGDPSQQQLTHGQPQHVVLHGHRQSEEHISQHIQHQLSRNAQTLSPGQSSEPRKISPQDIQQVQNLIERCLQLHMNKKEVISTLLNQAKIEPNFTGLVWQKLEEQNPDFFRAYYIRLTVKQQILRFNQLLEKQASIMERMATTNAPSVSNGLHSSAVNHGLHGYTMQPPEIPRVPSIDSSLLHSNSSTLNGAGLSSMHFSTDSASLRETKDIASNVRLPLHSYHSMPTKAEMDIQPISGFSNDSSFLHNGFHRSVDVQGDVIDAHVPAFNTNNSHPKTMDSLVGNNTGGLSDPAGLIPRNFSLSDLTADFTQASDIMESYSGSPFLTLENFLHSPDNDCLDDKRILDTVSEPLSYEDFASD